MLIVGHLITLVYISLTKSSADLATSSSSSTSTSTAGGGVSTGSNRSRLLCAILCRRIILLSLTLVTLFVVSFIQMSASHFSLNLKVLLFNLQSSASADSSATSTTSISTSSTSKPSSVTSLIEDVRLNMYTICIYGVLYPLLLGSVVPQFFAMAEANKFLVYNMRPHVALIFAWAALLIGSTTQSFISTYFIYLFKTPNSFIYTNIFASSMLIIFFIFYLRFSCST